MKNFGRSGRTKYTHLVDQDTTSFDSAWGQESAQNTKFFKQKAAGVRDVFERPSAKKRKVTWVGKYRLDPSFSSGFLYNYFLTWDHKIFSLAWID